MNTQPEALRLADALEDDLHADDGTTLGLYSQGIADNAAAELRRLYDKTVLADQVIEQRHVMISDLHALNAELLEALKLADALLWGANMNAVVVERKVKTAIAKAEGEQA